MSDKELEVGIKYISRKEQAIKDLEALIKVTQEFEKGIKQSSEGSKKATTELNKLSQSADKATKEHKEFIKAEKDLASATERTAKAQRKAKEETDRVSKSISKATNETKELSAMTKNLGGQLVTYGIMASAVYAAVRAFDSAVKITADYESQMKKVKAVTGATYAEMQELSKQAKELGAKTIFNARESAKAMAELGKAGFNTGEIMESLPGIMSLAASSGSDLAKSSEIAAGALRGFGLEASKAGHIADLFAAAANKSAVDVEDLGDSMQYIAPVARASGQSIEEMTAILSVLGDNMIKGSMAGTSLRQILLRLQDPPRETKEVLTQLGITITDLQGNILPLSTIIEQFRNKTQDLTTASKNQAASMIAGMDASSAFLALANTAPGQLQNVIESMQDVNGEAQKMEDIMNQGLNRAFDEATGAAETLGITLGDKLEPSIINTTNIITALIIELSEWVEKGETILAIAAKANQMTRELQGKYKYPIPSFIPAVEAGRIIATGSGTDHDIGEIAMLNKIRKLKGISSGSWRTWLSDKNKLDKETRDIMEQSANEAKIAYGVYRYGLEMFPALKPQEPEQISYNVPVHGTITSGFGLRKPPRPDASVVHEAVDISAKKGSLVNAIAKGTVIEVGSNAGLGNYIIVQHPDGHTSRYAHLLKSVVKKDQKIKAGQRLGYVGSTGVSTGDHLDLQIKDKTGKAIDPMELIPQLYSMIPAGTKSIDFSKIKDKKTATIKTKYAEEAALRKLEESLRNKESWFGLEKPQLEFAGYKLDDEKLQKLGLSADNIELIKIKGAELFDELKKIEEEYFQFKENQQKKADEIYKEAVEKQIKNRVDLQKKLNDIEANDKYSTEQRRAEVVGAKDTYYIDDQSIRKDYETKLNALKYANNIADLKHNQAYQEKIKKFTEEEIKIREESEKDIQELKLATQKIVEDTTNERIRLEKQATNDVLGLIDIEHKAKQQNIIQRIRLAEQLKNAEIERIETQINEEIRFDKEKETLREQQRQVEVNFNAQVEALAVEYHRNELERIEEEAQAWKSLFEQRLGFLAKISGFIGKFFGQNNIFSRVSGFISSNSSLFGDVFGKIFKTGVTGGGSLLGGLFNFSSKQKFKIQESIIEQLMPRATAFLGARSNAQQLFSAKGFKGLDGEFIPIVGEKGGLKALIAGKIGKNLFGTGTAGKILGPLSGAAAGGLLGYSLGQKNLALGMGGGLAGGALSGLMLGGPVGAAIGGGAGFLGGLFGWLFGGAKRRQIRNEGVKLGRLESEYSRVLAGSDYRRSQLTGTVNQGYYLTDFASTAHQLQSQIGEMNTYIAQINQQFDSSLYKRRGSEAQQIRNNLVNQANEQIAQLQELQKINEQKLKERENYLKEVKNQTEKEIAQMRAEYADNPYSFNQSQWNLDWYDSIFRVNEARVIYKDNAGLLALFNEKRQEEARLLYRQKALGLIEAEKNLSLLDFEIEFERLQSVDADDADILKQKYEKELIEHTFNIKRLQELFKDNADMLERINNLDTYKQENIQKELDEELKALEEAEQEKQLQETYAIQDLDYRIALEKLKAREAHGAEYVEVDKEKQLLDLQRYYDEARKMYEENEEYQTKLTEYYNLTRENIIKQSQENIRKEYEATADLAGDQLFNFNDLLKKMDDVRNRFDFTRAKTRQEQINNELEQLEKQARKQYPDMLEALKNFGIDSIQTLNADELKDIDEALKSINTFQNSQEFNNVINVNVTSSNASPQEIANAVKKVLADSQTRYAL